MYAVIKTGGKQYVVRPNQRIQVEKLNVAKGDAVSFPVLLHKEEGDEVRLESANVNVSATVLDQIRGNKIRIIKYKRRKHHRKQMGHRQHYSVLQINSIGGRDGS